MQQALNDADAKLHLLASRLTNEEWDTLIKHAQDHPLLSKHVQYMKAEVVEPEWEFAMEDGDPCEDVIGFVMWLIKERPSLTQFFDTETYKGKTLILPPPERMGKSQEPQTLTAEAFDQFWSGNNNVTPMPSVEETCVVDADDVDAWQSSLPSERSDREIAAYIDAVQKHKHFKHFMNLKAEQKVFSLTRTFGDDPLVDLDEWFDFLASGSGPCREIDLGQDRI